MCHGDVAMLILFVREIKKSRFLFFFKSELLHSRKYNYTDTYLES